MIKRVIEIALSSLLWVMVRPLLLRRTVLPVPREKIGRVLVLVWGGIGDALLCTPALQNLRRALPAATVVAVVSRQEAKEILEGSGLVDTAVVSPTEGVRGAAGIARKVAAPDTTTLCICMAGISPIAGSVLSFLAGARYRVGENGRMEGFFYTHSIRVEPAKHKAARNLDLLKRIGIPAGDDALVFLVPKEARRAVSSMLARERGITAGRLIAMAPGSGARQRFKRWRSGHFAELARLLHARGFQVALVGDASERALCEEIRNAAGEGAYNMSGRLSLNETAALISSSRLLISNDCALMHVSAALKIPVVAIFGPTSPCTNAPWKVPHKIVRMDLPCSPCYRYRPISCPYGMKCLMELKPAVVMQAVEELARETGGPM